jgi:hypothetical protein
MMSRRNRALQKQVEGLLTVEKPPSTKGSQGLDLADCSPGLPLQGISHKSSPKVVRVATQERKVVSPQDNCKGQVLTEIDENAVPGSFERCSINRRPPASPATTMQYKKAKLIMDEQ